ncbi:uncharacterized protein LOC111693654 [Trichogramma pretiosum]|uniref:uncharacterized protein LOC111693654 n=1 Tax=Trichogramma pretiosum TaxID=7493 RepID=UPI000C719C88|nr:uncharacterized protein LOC111693654 [Trichogramma pretiosum]
MEVAEMNGRLIFVIFASCALFVASIDAHPQPWVGESARHMCEKQVRNVSSIDQYCRTMSALMIHQASLWCDYVVDYGCYYSFYGQDQCKENWGNYACSRLRPARGSVEVSESTALETSSIANTITSKCVSAINSAFGTHELTDEDVHSGKFCRSVGHALRDLCGQFLDYYFMTLLTSNWLVALIFKIIKPYVCD